MSNLSVYTSIKNVVAAYRDKLHHCPQEQFQLSPATGGWSYSEVYSHIFDMSILSLEELKKCIAGNGQDKPTAFVVKLILFFGSFPPAAKYKVPKKLTSRVRKITKADAEEFIQLFLEELEYVHRDIHLARPDVKTIHPRLGYLNARQWFRFIEIHLKHHLKQLGRIEKNF